MNINNQKSKLYLKHQISSDHFYYKRKHALNTSVLNC